MNKVQTKNQFYNQYKKQKLIKTSQNSIKMFDIVILITIIIIRIILIIYFYYILII